MTTPAPEPGTGVAIFRKGSRLPVADGDERSNLLGCCFSRLSSAQKGLLLQVAANAIGVALITGHRAARDCALGFFLAGFNGAKRTG